MKEYKRRSLEELNIIDNFLFNEMLDMGEESKWFCKLQYGKELSDMLLFLENSSMENAGVDSDLQRMKRMADRIKSSPEKGAKHMRLEDEMYYRSQEAGREIAKELAPEMAREMAVDMAKDMVIKFLVSIYDKTESEAKELVEKHWEKNSWKYLNK